MPVGRRFWVWLSVFIAGIAFLLWFVPAVMRAHQSAPVHGDVVVLSPCAQDPVIVPAYGTRTPVSYCHQ